MRQRLSLTRRGNRGKDCFPSGAHILLVTRSNGMAGEYRRHVALSSKSLVRQDSSASPHPGNDNYPVHRERLKKSKHGRDLPTGTPSAPSGYAHQPQVSRLFHLQGWRPRPMLPEPILQMVEHLLDVQAPPIQLRQSTPGNGCWWRGGNRHVFVPPGSMRTTSRSS